MAYLATFGHEKKLVDISPINGVAGLKYFILVDSYYQGSIDFINGDWIPNLSRNNILTGDDVTVIISLIKENHPQDDG